MEFMTKAEKDAAKAILRDYQNSRLIDQFPGGLGANRENRNMVYLLWQLLLPGEAGEREKLVQEAVQCLHSRIAWAMGQSREDLVTAFLEQVPSIRALVLTDLQAAYAGDPAAKSYEEILLAYPGFFAVGVYRLAHGLHLLEIPRLPRMMTEFAHSITGIDIHPGATIGSHFFIDHGTGVVIGETAVIGNGVKLYQGVTLGGLSTHQGQKLRGQKRHPTIEDDVTIYANATVLGGDTVIGKGSTIGANVFLTASVEENTVVAVQNRAYQFHLRK